MRAIELRIIIWGLYILAILFLLALVITSYHFKIPISKFTRDPLALTNGNPFLGVFSNIGILLWAFSSAVSFFTGVLMQATKKGKEIATFCMMGGLISVVLLFDDLFMLHENLFPQLLGIDEKGVYLAYVMLIIFYVVKFRKIILETEYIFFLLAGGFFALSILIDALPILQRLPLDAHYFFEDGPKFLGIVSWLAYHFLVCFQTIQSSICHPESVKNPTLSQGNKYRGCSV